ncbi:MAG: dTDP-4-dehydrorhamnose reductase [Thermomicrobiales bacterium]
MAVRERVLVTGAAGQLGRYLRVALERAGYQVIGLGSKPSEGVDVVANIRDLPVLANVVGDTSPLILIHCAAYTDVDGCELDPELAMAVNATGSANVANVASDAGIWMLGLGTDFVFSGNGGAPYSERAKPDPISMYGSSKLAGERAILDADPSFAVARTSWVYGGAGKHFPRTVLNVVKQRGGMEVVDDEIGNPTFAGDLANALVQLMLHRPTGIFHLSNEGSVSRFGLARAVVAAAGGEPGVITPTTTEAFLAKYPLPAKRPANSSMANNRAAALGIRLPGWEDAVDRYVPRLAAELAG